MLFFKNGIPATKLSWIAPTTRTDGTPYGSADHGGYELGIKVGTVVTPFVSIPTAYNITEWQLSTLPFTEAKDYEVVLRTVDGGGRTSGWSTSVVFTVSIANPSKPTSVAIG